MTSSGFWLLSILKKRNRSLRLLTQTELVGTFGKVLISTGQTSNENHRTQHEPGLPWKTSGRERCFRSTGCSSARRLGLNSQPPHGSSSVTVCSASSRGSNAISCLPQTSGMCVVHKHTCRPNTYIHKIHFSFKKFS